MINKKLLQLAVISSFILKMIFIFFFHSEYLSNEWRVLLNNLENLGIFSYHYLDGQYLPSSYVPPLYLIFLYLNKLISFDLFNFMYLVFFFQVIISTFSVYFFYTICRHFFNYNFSNIGAIIFAFFPLLIYSNALISSATLQILFYLIFFNFCLNLIDQKKKQNIILFSLVCACCLLLRGEFLVVFVFTLIFFSIFVKEKIRYTLILSLITLFIISPYLIRNYINTSKVHIVNVTGYALWKGNNHLSKVEGYHFTLSPKPKRRLTWPDIPEFENLYKNLDKVEINKNYETERDKVFLNEAIKNISSDKKKYLILYFKKILSYFFIDFNSSIKNYYNPVHIIPVLGIAILSFFGGVLSIKQNKSLKLYYLLTVMFLFIMLISVFYILPRYKISIIIFQILFALFSLEFIFKKIRKK
tara:strand:+ start:523 stop:1767 length:1245 start_codon:yes stop_codon:yes gene_type:complete